MPTYNRRYGSSPTAYFRVNCTFTPFPQRQQREMMGFYSAIDLDLTMKLINVPEILSLRSFHFRRLVVIIPIPALRTNLV
jgi:hypothetical protein